jgi:hypothetical protein
MSRVVAGAGRKKHKKFERLSKSGYKAKRIAALTSTGYFGVYGSFCFGDKQKQKFRRDKSDLAFDQSL